MHRAGKIIGGLFFLLVLILLVAPFLVDLSFLKSRFLPQVEAALGRSVDVQSVRLSMWPFGIRLKKVVIRDDPQFSSDNFVRSDDIVLNLRLLPLLQKKVEVEQLLLHRPEVRLVQDQNGRWNTSTLGKGAGKESPPPGAPPQPKQPVGIAADRLTIKEGKIIYLRRLKEGAPLSTSAEKIDLTVTDLQLGKTASVALKSRLEPQGKEVRLDGKIGPLTPALRPERIELSGAVGRNDLRLNGGFQKGRLLLTANSNQIDVDDLMLLLPQSAPSNSSKAAAPPDRSSASIPVEVAFNFKKVRMKGIEADDLSGKAIMDHKGGSLQDLQGGLWGGRVAGSARIETAAAFPFSTNFSLQGVSLGALVNQFTPVSPDLFSGAASVRLGLQGSGGSWESLAKTLTGEGQWEVGEGEIKNVNLVREALSALRTLDVVQLPLEPKTSFSSAKGAFRVDAGRIDLGNLLMNSGLFQLAGKGEITMEGAYRLLGEMKLAESLTQRLRKTPAGSLLPVQGGKLEIPIEIAGTPQRARLAVREEALKQATAKKLRERLSDRLEKEGLGGLLKK